MSDAPIRLFVDDLREPPAGWTVARSSAEAIAVLEAGSVAAVALDHDLGGEDTGLRVIEWFERAVADDPEIELPAFSIHSANPVGAARMRTAIEALIEIHADLRRIAARKRAQHGRTAAQLGAETREQARDIAVRRIER